MTIAVQPATVDGAPIEAASPSPPLRPRVRGKFLFVGDQKLYIRGVTYGTFRPDADGCDYPEPSTVDRDLAQMAANGLNALRTYTVPPRWLLDLAQQHSLRVMVGLPWEQHITFLDAPERATAIEARVRAGVRDCAGHPAVLCFSIGNEIPAPIVRWHGARRVQAFLERLYRAAKQEDPDALVTYVNYPSTEYLDLPFLDFVCFNVYLEAIDRLEAYLARLQNLAGDRPLVMGEIGLDSRRNGEARQADYLDAQVRAVFRAGCTGAFVFAWTDEWHRGGFDVDDWDFGLVDRQREPKPALAAVRRAFAEVPFPTDLDWPKVSVVVCSYNGERTIRNCCEGLKALEYPDYEVIVVDDGSTDQTAAIAGEYGFRVVSTPNWGLSAARNLGLRLARGEIVAYTDDDARPDPHWLQYLAATFLRTEHAGVGGPNVAPPGDGWIADCVAHAPGGPVHVLLTDTEAEHIPGCNMAFRKSCLQAVGGFDVRYRTAGDDVDLCWRLQQQGWTVGFSPAALVWHHRRNSLRAYWKQQRGYGKAEALLEQKWPEKYNAAGHISWAGRLYGQGLTRALGISRPRIYQGTWGSAPFQAVYPTEPGLLGSLPLMPEWYLAILALAALAALSALWQPLLLTVPFLGLAVGAPLLQAGRSAARASFSSAPASPRPSYRCWLVTMLLHLLQPMARLWGRLSHGLSPWRRRGGPGSTLPVPWQLACWSERWRSHESRLQGLEAALEQDGAVAFRGGDFDGWDLEVRGGLFGLARLLVTIEEHGDGKQLTRFRAWPKPKPRVLVLLAGLLALAGLAALDQAWGASALLAGGAWLLAVRAMQECSMALGALRVALRAQPGQRLPGAAHGLPHGVRYSGA